ncbi:hypothetical protein ACFRMQ_16130 [Kitasatospora sp. NPDC056783]|uniref:hypothetical protein n=1 Tax=Kitasatospora sp. NPDC056783 TaxID=3345943 RepID=UPI0036AF3200
MSKAARPAMNIGSHGFRTSNRRPASLSVRLSAVMESRSTGLDVDVGFLPVDGQ